ncbi:protein containing Transposase, IS605 OrfB [Candidatus Magnetobacterium bavaricum]|uniref:Protein containing Transposase, IS605 OrfB n=1 Tax=Candidatus Magnetobacterium bavaricum TaxID=29290 RepID=A0A0F3H0G4_9BACT|nr:protein containing Transposase, IS605 OrfB [Candidatus Magnetobacterium bavaricum]
MLYIQVTLVYTEVNLHEIVVRRVYGYEEARYKALMQEHHFQPQAIRSGELFKCRSCGYTADADYNASLHILNRFRLQAYMVPVHKNYQYGNICP